MKEGRAFSAEDLAGMVWDARERTFELVADLTDAQLMGPQLAIVNPMRWEIGHVTWFQEKWVLRHLGGVPSVRADADALYDSMAIPHDTRWDLPLASRTETLAYMREVRDRVIDRLRAGEPDPDLVYFTLLSVFHEDMHTEAFTYTRQTHGYPAPHLFLDERPPTNDHRRRSGQGAVTHHPSDRSDPSDPDRSRLTDDASSDRRSSFVVGRSSAPNPQSDAGPHPGDASIPGGTLMLGATPDEPFVFDNEKWAHPVEVRPFAIARAPVTQSEFAAFVDDGGYRRQALWSEAGWQWREMAGAERPVHWRREPDRRWLRRDFDRWVPLEPHRPIIHCNWYEADAYCRWAGRRLPAEAEWEMAAAAEPAPDGRGITGRKRRFPWGDDPPAPDRANLDWRAMGCLDVAALPAGDSAFGCRQMIGNTWEWTADDFLSYPGFVIDPYKEYSEPWFGDHKVLRGGCWTTRSRLLRNTWRNFYKPDRRDVWAGFRTCPL